MSTLRQKESWLMTERRKVDTVCKARNIRCEFKLIYHGVEGRRNAVVVILKVEYLKRLLEVKRVSD